MNKNNPRIGCIEKLNVHFFMNLLHYARLNFKLGVGCANLSSRQLLHKQNLHLNNCQGLSHKPSLKHEVNLF